MVFVFACLLFGLKCFHSILTNMLWIERKPLPKQTGLPYHCLSMTKGLMPCSRKESIVALYESVISPAPSVLPVYMMEFHGKDTDMLHVNQQRPNIQVSEAVNVVPLPSLPDRTDVAYVSDESESPDPAEETPQWKFQHVETSLSSDREYGCSDLSSFQTSRGNIHFTGNEKPSGNTVSLHSSTKMQKGKLIYGTSSDYISNFLSQRRTPARMRGVLRHPILQNMSTEEGFQRDVHYERWKDVAEDEFGRMMVCRGRDNHTVFTFFMIERNSNWFRDEELLFYLKCDGKVQIVPELLGVIEEDGYVKMMFPFTPGHEVLSTVVEAGRHLCNRKGLLRFLEQLVRGIEKLHANGVTLGVINDRMVLLDAELGSTGIHLFPWRSVRTTEHTNKKSTNQPLRGADPLTRAGKEDKATDMLSLGQLLQRILSRLQDPSPLATHLLVQLLEPDKEVRITASGASKHRLFEHRRCLSIECGEDAPII
ncbi:uncharacterized protein LOC110462689 isoform X2 [Mizuhopecten yessoensis]|uniref:Protein kinase domain-containing protein n=1 Tax=Mizuhopecten yessoensis TaxID=6573 RepID=A0A210PXU3_MIZYE|nr:uncharacterized protein LOC110462689 isoform X2 [Mizuhopecten yessoensis]OWF41301.1 hypothetical protein KP79_PYT13138 [Mizuhopecten yessoensis]